MFIISLVTVVNTLPSLGSEGSLRGYQRINMKETWIVKINH